jgi:adenylate kinase
MSTTQAALVLLGPTSSGKTPLGEMLATRGFRSTKCLHFDFGHQLRRVVARAQPDPILSRQDIDFLERVLAEGALLENNDFPIALRILQSFLLESKVDKRQLVVTNGLPRHVGQAESLQLVLDMRTVVCLNCEPDVVVQRVASNAGGDRTHRTDDDLASVRRKLEIYAQRTVPLLQYFRDAGSEIIEVQVGLDTTVDNMWSALSGGH